MFFILACNIVVIMTISRTKLALGVVIAGAVIAAAIIYFPTRPKTDSNPQSDDRLFLPAENIVVPSGWYFHRISGAYVLLTRGEKLPGIGNTEIYAYGEQIGIELLKTDRSPEEWAALQAPDDDPLVLSKRWNTERAYKVLRVEHEAAGAAGKQLTQYLFTNNRVYAFSLYPLESFDSANNHSVRNEQNIVVLEQVLSDYAASLK